MTKICIFGHFDSFFGIRYSAISAEYSAEYFRSKLAEYSAEYSVFGRTLLITRAEKSTLGPHFLAMTVYDRDLHQQNEL